MMFKNIIYLGLLALGLFSCNDRSVNDIVDDKKVSLNHKRDIFLPMDSETASINNYYQLIEDDSKLLLLFFNPLNYCIYTYDLNSESLVSKRQFDKVGPNGLGEEVTSFIASNDSTVIFHSYYRSELIYANIDGSVSFRHKLKNQEYDYTPKTSQNTPFVIFDQNLFMASGATSNWDDLDNISMLLNYSLVDSSIRDTDVRLPSLYRTSSSRYFPAYLSELSLDMNQANETTIISFPLDDSIRIVGIDGVVSAKFLGSAMHKLKESLSKSGGPKGMLARRKDILRYSRYGAVKYDPHRGVYLRIFNRDTPERLLEENVLKSEQKIIFANRDFDILGVADFLGTEQFLFSKEGMLQVIMSTSQEDSLKIKVFEYEF